MVNGNFSFCFYFYELQLDSSESGTRANELSSGLISANSSFSAHHPTNNAYLTTFLLLNTMIGSGILNQVFYIDFRI